MKKLNNKFIKISAIAIPSLLMLASIGATTISVLSAALVYSKDVYFTYTEVFNEGEENEYSCKYKCYTVDSATHTVAVAWSEENTSFPSQLDIPDYVTDDEDTNETKQRFKVVAIDNGGFRYCTSSAITVPNTVEEIREEAFAYCQNIESFSIPYQVEEIAPSTFLDCRELKTITYLDEQGSKSLENSTIKSIGDHAFDSCVKLCNFYCPSSVETFGTSCFQKCENLLSFRFPSANSGVTNLIHVYPYAFADCKKLSTIYFETNMSKIDHHAFIDCSLQLKINYTGEVVENDPSAGLDGLFAVSNQYNHWRDVFLASNRPELIPIIPEVPEVDASAGFIYYEQTGRIKLDSAGPNATTVYFNNSTDENYVESYIVIKEYEAPLEADNINYFVHNDENDTPDGFTLKIPETIASKKVLIIDETAFADNLNLKKVIFSKNLVQIRNMAFLGCTNICDLDFSKCENLKEISYDVFQTCDQTGNKKGYLEVYNEDLHSLNLPACLEYVGEFAFYNFIRLNGNIRFDVSNIPGEHSHLKVIGAYAFAINRNIEDSDNPNKKELQKEGIINLVVPWSLNDTDAYEANYYHLHHDSTDKTRYINIDYGSGNNRRGYAIGTHAFDNATTFNSVTIEQRYNAFFIKRADAWEELTISSHGVGAPSDNDGTEGDYYVDTTDKDNVLYLRGASSWNTVSIASENITEDDPNTAEVTGNVGDYYVNTASYDSASGIPSKANYMTSLASNAFVRCSSLIRVRTNTNLCYLGKDAFKGLTSLREIFLYSENAAAQTKSNTPWGMNDNNWNYASADALFNTNSKTNAVIYVTGPNSGNISTTSASYSPSWNTDGGNPTYRNDLSNNVGTVSNRSQIPTFFNVDWPSNEDILYFNPDTNAEKRGFVDAPVTLDDYTQGASGKGVIALARDSDGNYAVTRYFCDSSNYSAEIDLTNLTKDTVNISNKITKIGDEAFATDSSEKMGFYFILPNSIVEIGERAFFRNNGNSDRGVRIVTYKSGNTVVAPGDTTYASAKTSETGGGTAGYCCLPPNVKTIKRSAFYNNRFKTINLNSGIKFIGNAAFLTYYGNSSKIQTIMIDGQANDANHQSITFGDDSKYSLIGNGIYFNEAATKTLIYQAAGDRTQVSLPLAVDGGTKAIGYRACANSNYTSVTLPNGLTHIYGGAFQNSTRITQVDGAGLATLQYISTSSSTEIYNTNTHGDYFDNEDYRNMNKTDAEKKYSRSAAFSGCSNLETLDFTQMSSIVKIGRLAFNGCAKLKYMAGSNTYKFVTCSHTGGNAFGGTTTENTPVTVGSGDGTVLDLSNLGNLTHIGISAFSGCNNISYAILPDKTSSAARTVAGHQTLYKPGGVAKDFYYRTVASGFRYGDDSTDGTGQVFKRNSGSVILLVGETANQADSSSQFKIQGISDLKPGEHYRSYNGCTQYYYVQYKDDINWVDPTKQRYWTKVSDGNGGYKYILFANGYEVVDYPGLDFYTPPQS